MMSRLSNGSDERRHMSVRVVPYGKVAVVSGSSGGVGSAIVARLVSEDYRVLALDRVDPAATPSVREGDAILVDLAKSDEVAAAVTGIRERVEHVDALIHCAGRVLLQDPRVTSNEDFDQVMAVNVRSAWELSIGLLRLMTHGAGRSVVLIGSTHPRQTKISSFPYNVSKGAVLALSKSLAVDLGPMGFRVNSVSPGYVATPMSEDWVAGQADPEAVRKNIESALPGSGPPTPRDVANAVLFLISDQAVGISGIDLLVDAGRSAMRP